MAKANRLTTRIIDRIDAPGVYGDGNTLFLRVRDNGEGGRGSAAWTQIVKIDGKRYERGLGGYPLVSLEEARQVAFDNRRRARRGDNPFVKPSVATVAPAFAEALEAVLEVNACDWKGGVDGRSARQWRATMLRYAVPTLGSMAVDAIQSPDVLACVKPLWRDKRDTAEKVKNRISTVMRWAIAEGYRADNPVAAVDAHLPTKRKPRKHHEALPYAEVPSAIATVRDSNAHPATKLAFEFLVLTAARSTEACGATWDEIDLDEEVWRIPAERMGKTKVEHTVPLSVASADVLIEAEKRYGGEGLIFPTPKGTPLQNARLTELLHKLGIKAVPHGFRTSFRNWAGEHGLDHYVADAALSHKIKDSVEAAYHRTTYLEKRRKVMEQWADHCLPKD